MKADNEDIVEMTDENGNTYKAEVIELVTVDDKEYAVLSPVDEEGEEEGCDCGEDDCSCADYVLMRVINEGDDYSFETIDDDDEFEKVSEYIENAADEIED